MPRKSRSTSTDDTTQQLLGYEELRNHTRGLLEAGTLSTRKIAERCQGLSHGTISKFAKGQCELTGPKIVELAAALSVRVCIG